MERLFSFVLVLFLASLPDVIAQPAGCSPPTTSGACATAIPLAVSAPCVNGTTCAGGAQAASSCLFAGSQCSWYSFTATATNMYVNVDVTATNGCHISSNVYRATGTCTGLTEVSCQAGAPLDDLHALTGLTVGALYYVQVCYSPGGPCGNNGTAQYCIDVGVPDPPCNTCSSPCGTALGFTTTPSVQQVVDLCETSPFVPALQPGSLNTFCYNFTATNTSVNFNVIITSNCASGNVTSFSWQLYNSPACGGPIQTGTLAGLTFSGLTIGNSYVFCYTFNVPSTCTHSQHCPYFVGAFIPLPVTWLDVAAYATGNGQVAVEWSTASERNNDHFTVERSADAVEFIPIGMVSGAGTTQSVHTYRFMDEAPLPGTSFYRIAQTDIDGATDRSRTVAVHRDALTDPITLLPNPVTGNALLGFNSVEEGIVTIEVRDMNGRLISTLRHMTSVGMNSVPLNTAPLAQGVYMVAVISASQRSTARFIKGRP